MTVNQAPVRTSSHFPHVAALLSLLLAACAMPEPAPRRGEIWDGALTRSFTREEAMTRLAGADHVLLGEKHDNAEHHRLQAEIVREIAARGRRPALVLEMLGHDQAPALATYLAGRPGDARGFVAAVGWRWNDWPMYEPILTAALGAEWPIAAGNLGRDTTRAIMRGGSEATASLPPLPSGAEAALLDQLEASHCGHVPRERLGPMLQVQRARDGSMAAAMAANPQSVLITGAEHARTDRGVPWMLRGLAPGKRVLALAFVELRDGAPPPRELPFDVVWFTAEKERGDPCAQFAPRAPSG